MTDLTQNTLPEPTSFSLESITTIIALIDAQKKTYFDISFYRNNHPSIILKASKKGTTLSDTPTQVALKVIEYNNETFDQIETMQRAQACLKSLFHSDYILAIHEQFYLTEAYQKPQENTNNDSTSLAESVNKYYVQEIEFIEGILLSEYLEQVKKDKTTIIDEQFMEMIAVQMLDAVNLLHQHQLTHGDIKTQNFFVTKNQQQQVQVKLTNFGHRLDSQVSRNQTFNDNNNQISPSKQDNNINIHISQDLFLLGEVLLELDNIISQDGLSISPNNILTTQNHNRNSFIFQSAVNFLTQQNNNTNNAKTALLLLLQKSQAYNTIPLFSLVTKNTVNAMSLLIPQYDKNQQVQQNLKTESSIKTTQQTYTPLITIDLLKNALMVMFSWTDYADAYDILQLNSNQIFLGVNNLKHQRQSILKLSLCSNKSATLTEISMMKISQGPQTIRFYKEIFFEDAFNNTFIVFELERSKYSLQDYLEQQRIQMKEYSEEQKYAIMLQMINSVECLRQHKIIHGNIILNSFVIVEQEDNKIIVKLNDFSHATYSQDTFMEDSQIQKQIISLRKNINIYSPFNYFTFDKSQQLLQFKADNLQYPINHPHTYHTDIYSLSLSMTILFNYLKQQNNSISKRFLTYLHQQKKSINDYLDKSKGYYEYLNHLDITLIQPTVDLDYSNSVQFLTQLHNNPHFISASMNISTLSLSLESMVIGDTAAQQLLSPLSNLKNLTNLSLDLKRNQLKSSNNSQQLLSFLNSLINLSSLSLDLHDNYIECTSTQSFLQPLSNLINLSYLQINLNYNRLGDNISPQFLSPLGNLINLQSLTLSFEGNQMSDLAASSLLTPLVYLIDLSYFSLSLQFNEIKKIGAQKLFIPLNNTLNLSNFSLNIRYNNIGPIGAQSLLSPLSNLLNLRNISLNLENNQIADFGAQLILLPLINLTNLQNLSLNISRNEIKSTGAQSLLFPIQKHKNLSCITLNSQYNPIKTIGAQLLLQPLAYLLNLTSLSINLNRSEIEPTGQFTLLNPLTNLRNLTHLSLEIPYNLIKSISAQSLLIPLANLTNLLSLQLDLNFACIEDIGAKALLSPLSNLFNLQNITVNLDNNSIKTFGGQSVLVPLTNLINLSNIALSMNNNSLGNLEVSSLLIPIANIHKISSILINLNHNQIDDNGALSMLSPLSKLNNLSSLSLNLENTQIKSNGPKLFLSPLYDLINLSLLSINLEFNYIKNTEIFAFLFSLENLLPLSHLQLNLYENISGKKLNHIIDYFTKYQIDKFLY